MALVRIDKISGVIRITHTAGKAKSYINPAISYSPSPTGTHVNVVIGEETINIALSDLSIGNNAPPTTIDTALTLLNSIFGT